MKFKHEIENDPQNFIRPPTKEALLMGLLEVLANMLQEMEAQKK
jgi:hypothetical protein